MNSIRCIIIGSAEIKNYEKISRFINPEDFIIACDGGLNHVEKLGLSPSALNLVVGDFDSFPRDKVLRQAQQPQGEFVFEGQIIQLPCEKDDTDVFFAVKEALRRSFTDFVLVGVIGQRFDHSLVNISVLQFLQKNGASGVIYDDYSKMKLVVAGAEPVLVPDTYSYFSLMCIAGDVSGVTIKNAKYPLEDATITSDYQYGVSNEVLPGQTAEVTLEKGVLLLVMVW